MTTENRIEQKWMSDLPSLVEAALASDQKYIEMTAMTFVRRLRKNFPDVSREIAKVLNGYSKGAGAFRSVGIAPPADRDSHANLLQVNEKVQGILKPLLNDPVERIVGRFVEEREREEELLAAGVFPANKMLLTGAPGTGKTMLATWLAQELNMKLAVFDLATSISSLLGNTGLNIKRIFDYAKQESVILFLDEFDAIAKRRDDTTDVGELKRIVNVLLKEMETWPSRSILIAATNHPEILDPAIYRRFDSCISLPMPGTDQIKKIVIRTLGSHSENISKKMLDVVGQVLKGSNSSDVVLFANNSLKQHLISGDTLEDSLLTTLIVQARHIDPKRVGAICRIAKEMLGSKISIRKLAELSGLSSTAVQYQIKKGATK